jgi:hypothetical protein
MAQQPEPDVGPWAPLSSPTIPLYLELFSSSSLHPSTSSHLLPLHQSIFFLVSQCISYYLLCCIIFSLGYVSSILIINCTSAAISLLWDVSSWCLERQPCKFLYQIFIAVRRRVHRRAGKQSVW